MKKTELTPEKITKSGKFPAITIEEKSDDGVITKTTTFRVDKLNTLILYRKEETIIPNRVTVHMDGSKTLYFEFDTYPEAEETYNYILETW